MPLSGALTVTHPGGETRPRGYWVVRTSPIFHTELLWCTHTRLNAHILLPFTLTKFYLTALFPFCSELKYFISSKSILVHRSVCMPYSKPWETIHHANWAVSQVKMNWLWVRAMRSRAYGSDEAENWRQRKTKSEGEGKTQRKKEKNKGWGREKEREVS